MTSTTERPSAPAPTAEIAPNPSGRGTADVQHSWAARVTGVLESIGALDAVDGVVEGIAKRGLTGGTRRRRVADLLGGRFLGHPLHPAVSDVPIGMWTSSVFLDVLGDGTAAGTLTAGGIVASTVTAASGVADWTGTAGRNRRVGLAHGLLNTGVLAVEVASLAARLRGRRGRALLLNAAGLALAGGAAWLGGELSLGRAVGVDHTVFLRGPEEWTPVMPLDDLPEGGTKAVDVVGRRILLHRDAEGIHAMENRCSHQGGPLDEGEITDTTVTCPWHGSCFSLKDGRVLGGPAAYPQPRLQARARRGAVEVRGRTDE